jgi:hypothetical protein
MTAMTIPNRQTHGLDFGGAAAVVADLHAAADVVASLDRA